MNRKKDPCRNFMRGSCRYGDRCKFSHAINTQHQQQTNNPFGFGAFAQQPKGAFASVPPKQQQHQQFKPFENKWTRTPDATSPNYTTQSNDQQPQPANHFCKDPESCKRIMLDDFQKERPMWILTCYAHFKHLPCDMVGDISYEELRAAAYNDAKNGMSLSHVVERERNLLNSKLIEFENLLRTVPVEPSSFPGSSISASPAINVLPSVSSFSQLGITKIQGSNTSTVAPANNGFGQQSPFAIASQTLSSNTGSGKQNPFSSQTLTSQSSFGLQNTFPVPSQISTSQSSFGQQNTFPVSGQNSNSFFGQQSPFPVPSQTSGSVGANNTTFGAQGFFGNQQVQPHGTASGFSSPFGFGGNISASKNGSLQSSSVVINQPSIFSSGGNDISGEQTGKCQEDVPGDMSIWFKEKWDPGEIPEDAPPEKLCV